MKKTIFGISPFLVQVLAIVLNFNSLLQGSTATGMNVTISLLYFAFWICFIPAMKRYNAYRGFLASLVFWGLVLLTALLTLTVNIFDIDLPMLVPFTTLFLAPNLWRTYRAAIQHGRAFDNSNYCNRLYSILCCRSKASEKKLT